MNDQQTPKIIWYKNKMYWGVLMIILLMILCQYVGEHYELPNCEPFIHNVECGL